MKKEALSIVKKTAKIAGVTCVAAGAIAIMTSGTALTAIGTGFRYVKDTVVKILKETSEEKDMVDAEDPAPVDPDPTEEASAAEKVIAEA